MCVHVCACCACVVQFCMWQQCAYMCVHVCICVYMCVHVCACCACVVQFCMWRSLFRAGLVYTSVLLSRALHHNQAAHTNMEL